MRGRYFYQWKIKASFDLSYHEQEIKKMEPHPLSGADADLFPIAGMTVNAVHVGNQAGGVLAFGGHQKLAIRNRLICIKQSG